MITRSGETFPDPLLGITLEGRYQLEAKIGAGGMGSIYRAQQLNVNRDVAVKILSQEVFGDDTIVQRFRNEAKIIAQLRHPNTLKLIDIGTFPDGRLYLVTEFLEGQPLNRVLRTSLLSVERTLRILSQICASLEEAHSYGIVHRDLKPANVFLVTVGSDEVVKVLDFGIAKLSHQPGLTVAGAVFGTPAYMSPEQAKSEEVDPRSDLYSLGAIAYEALVGRRLFEVDSPAAVLLKQIHESPVPIKELDPSIPDPIAAFVHTLLEKDPARRPDSVQAVREHLEFLLAWCSTQFGSTPPLMEGRQPGGNPGGASLSPRVLRDEAHSVEGFLGALPDHTQAPAARSGPERAIESSSALGQSMSGLAPSEVGHSIPPASQSLPSMGPDSLPLAEPLPAVVPTTDVVLDGTIGALPLPAPRRSKPVLWFFAIFVLLVAVYGLWLVTRGPAFVASPLHQGRVGGHVTKPAAASEPERSVPKLPPVLSSREVAPPPAPDRTLPLPLPLPPAKNPAHIEGSVAPVPVKEAKRPVKKRPKRKFKRRASKRPTATPPEPPKPAEMPVAPIEFGHVRVTVLTTSGRRLPAEVTVGKIVKLGPTPTLIRLEAKKAHIVRIKPAGYRASMKLVTLQPGETREIPLIADLEDQ